MRFISGWILLFTLCSAANAENLRILAGQSYVVSPVKQNQRFERLHIGDNATIRFTPGVKKWQLSAERAWIGKNVRIIGSGQDGQRGGNPPVTAPRRADDCVDGRDGRDGYPGTSGSNGIDITLSLGIVELGGLQVISQGGDGGDGGDGADGQDGGQTARCRGGKGGDGGNGGSSGDGGKGGDVLIRYWKPGGEPLREWESRIQVSNLGGKAGEAGAGGRGGSGSEGAYKPGAGGPGGARWLAGGKNGDDGKKGNSGSDGSAGRLLVSADVQQQLSTLQRQLELTQSVETPVQALAPSVENRINELERRVEELERKLKRLTD